MIFDKACRKRRKVNCCDECVRFNNCRDGVPYEPKNYQGCLKLGYGIIGSVCKEYEHAYANGNISRCANLEQWLKSPQPTILSAEKYDGVALYDALLKNCQKKYGKLEDVYEKKVVKVKEKIRDIKEQIKETTDVKQKQRLKSQINKLRGEI